MKTLKLLLVAFTAMLLTSCMVSAPATAQGRAQVNYEFEYGYDYDAIDYLYNYNYSYFYTQMYVDRFGISFYWYQHPYFQRYRTQYYQRNHRHLQVYTHRTYQHRNRSRYVRTSTQNRSHLADRARTIRVKPRSLPARARMNKYPIRNYTKPRVTQPRTRATKPVQRRSTQSRSRK